MFEMTEKFIFHCKIIVSFCVILYLTIENEIFWCARQDLLFIIIYICFYLQICWYLYDIYDIISKDFKTAKSKYLIFNC